MSEGFLYETHLHTSDGSACGSSTAEEHVLAHYKKGYSGIVISDHFFNGNCAVAKDLSWKNRVLAFCKGYEHAKKIAEDLDFDVFFGFEYNFRGTEFLTYGIDKEFLLEHADMLEWSIEEYFDIIHKAGGFIIHAHPFRMRSYIAEIRLYTDFIDAVEVVNLGNENEEFDKKAYSYAVEHGFPMTKGSDIHGIKGICGGGMRFPARPRDIFDFIEMIKTNDDVI